MGIASRIASRPAVREAAGVLVDIARDKIKERRRGGSVAPSTGERATMVNEAAAAIAERPALVNAMNAEPLIQSRVVVGIATSFAGFILARFDVAGDTRNFVLENMPLFLEALGMLVAAIGRTVKGLPPINWRKPWSIFGIGR